MMNMITAFVIRNGSVLYHRTLNNLSRIKGKLRPNDIILLVYVVNGEVVFEKNQADVYFNI